MPLVMLIARDPGGANVLLPLIAPLKAQGFSIALAGKDSALKSFRAAGHSVIELGTGEVEEVLGRLFDQHQPAYLLTGTSADDNTERLAWRIAKARGIPSGAVLDQWVNYGIRFAAPEIKTPQAYRQKPELVCQPDRIFIMDDFARTEMEALGFPPERLLVSGQPYLGNLQYAMESTPAATQVKDELGIDTHGKVIVFASQPLAALYPAERAEDSYYGYTEHSALRMLLNSLQTLDWPETLTLLIKLHPREEASPFEDWQASNVFPKGLQVRVTQSLSPSQTLAIANVVCGMSSVLLIEAFASGRPVISIQPGLKTEDPLVLGRQGLIIPATDTHTLTLQLRYALAREIAAPNGWLTAHQDAARFIVESIRSHLSR